MSTEPKIQFFLGANAPTGFYSLYDQLLDPAEAEDILILKGGPGCGKSTLMRRVAQKAEERGLLVEYIPCSGDPDSLDAIVLPERRAAIVDGTAPHVVEPKYPGVVERYLNLGECYDLAGLKAARKEIMAAMKGYKACYARAYRCLDAAAEIASDMRALVVTPAVEEKIARRAKGILSREVKRTGEGTGTVKQRFLSGITHKGVMVEFDTVDRLCKRVYELSDTYGLGHLMLTHLLAGAVAAGHNVIACPSPMAPDRLEHVLIPDLSLGFITSSPSQPYEKRPYRRIRMDAMADPDAVHRSKARLKFSRKVSGALMEEAISSLDQAKTMHDDLEALYNPYVDFDKVQARADGVAKEILGDPK